MTDKLKKILIISGPTGAGKSSVAIRLAKHLKSDVINLDSVQVYRYFNIGSAKLSTDEMQGVRHHLIDIAEPTEQLNAATYAKLADLKICELSNDAKLPIFCGGSNLYLKALLYGLTPIIPKINNDLSEYNSLSNQILLEKLSALDPQRAFELHVNDRVRILRAIEIVESTGIKPTELSKDHGFQNPKYQALIIVLVKDRHELIEAISIRANTMLQRGLMQETEQIIARFGKDIPPLRSIGYSQVVDLIEGKIKSSHLSSEIVKATRRYAKQQMTFWKNEPAKRNWKYLPIETNLTSIIDLNHSEDSNRFLVQAARPQHLEGLIDTYCSVPTKDEISYLFMKA